MTQKIPSFLESNRDFLYKTPLYASKVVSQLKTIPKKERIKKIKKAGFNVFTLKADGIAIDLLTDSGTGSLSDQQLSTMMVADEAYAGASSFYKLKKTISDLLGIDYVIPTHQGRGAEKILNLILTTSTFRKEQSRYLNEMIGKKITRQPIEDLIDGKGFRKRQVTC